LDALRHLLDKLKLVFMEEAKTKGEEISQTLLRIMESIVTEGNRDITNTATAQEEGDLSQDGDGTHMDMFLEKLSSPLLMQLATPQSQQVVAAITRVLPFLTYGVEKTMAKLLDFFLPHLKVLVDLLNVHISYFMPSWTSLTPKPTARNSTSGHPHWRPRRCSTPTRTIWTASCM